MSNTSKKIFIVGAPRSGTTLLQGMLTAHPRVFSLPETFFFAKVSGKSWIKRYLFWPSIKVRKHLKRLVHEMGRDDLLNKAEIGLFQRDYARPFVDVMDTMAIDNGKDVWVEKTPWHLYCIDLILKEIPDAVFIHIVRGGEDTVASLYKASNSNPEGWAFLRTRFKPKFKGFSIKECVERWNRDVSISMNYFRKPGHYVVRYEDIVSNPKDEMRAICDFLSIDYSDSMIKSSASYSRIVRTDEAWKENTAGDVAKHGGTFDRIFNDAQKEYIRRSLLNMDVTL